MPPFVALALIGVPLVMAQPADRREEILQACLAIDNERDRLGCLEAELRGEPRRVSQGPDGAPAPEPAAAPPTSPLPSAASEPAEKRASQSPATRAEPTRRMVTIVKVRRSGLGQTYFETADGRVLLQRSTNRGRYPDTPFEAELSDAARDTYFLTSPLGGPRVRVGIPD